jgi:tRNA splicing ligase
LPVQVNNKTFNLEGRVEFGGCLRAVTLTADGFETHEIQNTIFKPVVVPTRDFIEVQPGSFVDRLRNSKYINEHQYGHISSFNFDRDCFYDRKWDAQTIKARGLFINTATNEIVARSYNKFFNIGERDHLRVENLQNVLKFPVQTFIKENGFLGIVGYDSETERIITTSKSALDGPFRDWFNTQFQNILEKNMNSDEIKTYLKDKDVSMVFECIEPVNDPHIIEYTKPEIVLLDIVKREEEFKKLPYSDVRVTGFKFGFDYKTHVITIDNWQAFYDFYKQISQEDFTLNGTPIEGFVFEDAEGYMLKYKTYFYSFWKGFRKVTEKLVKGRDPRTMQFFTAEHNKVYTWLKDLPKEELTKDIIQLRNMYYRQAI